MKTADVLSSAIRNTFRSKLRTTLTVVAIFIGAFTLTVTSAIGAGISDYIDNQLGALGAEGVLTVMHTPENQFGSDDGPVLYDPDKAQAGLPGGGPPGLSIEPITESDLAMIEAVDGVSRAEPVVFVSADYISAPDSRRYEISLNPMAAATAPDLAAGTGLTSSGMNEIVLPDNYLEAFGFATAADAVGTTAILGITDALGEPHEITATIVGVQNSTLIDIGAAINDSLITDLSDARSTGRPTEASVGYLAAIAHLDADVDADTTAGIKSELAEKGFTAQTTADQIGQFQAVISGIIGFLGSAIGAGVAILGGSIISSVLADTVLSGLPGLHIMLFEPLTVLTVILVVMAIAFIAGTLPARRAALQNPIDAIRYE